MNAKTTTFEDCATVVMLTQPFFATLLMKVQHVEDPNQPTCYVANKKLGYNPAFFASLTQDEGVFVVCHEILHLVYMHLDSMRRYHASGMGPDGKAYNHKLMNCATDFPINDALKVSNIGTMPKVGLWEARFPHTMLPEEVYEILNKELEEKCKGGKGSPGDGMPEGGFDEHNLDKDSPDEMPAITPADVMQAVNVARMSRGSLPAGIDRLIAEIKKPSVSPWKQLRQMVITAMHGRDASSWNRLQRRMIVRGIGMPGPIAHGSGHIGIVIDTSGSIGQEMLNLFAGHMAAIIDEAKPREVTLFWVDTDVGRVDKIKTSTQLRDMLMSKAFRAPGGGGTDMPVGVEAAMNAKCDVCVVLTDGYTPFGEQQKKPVIWAITSSVKSPVGKTVHIS